MKNGLKVCPVCGTGNPAENVTCHACGYILTNVLPTRSSFPESVTTATNQDVTMREMRKYVVFKFAEHEIQVQDGEVIGRQGKGAEFFRDVPEVSRRHAKITFDGADVYITDLNSTNGVFVDGELIRPGVPVKLNLGSKVRLCSKVTLELVMVKLPGLGLADRNADDSPARTQATAEGIQLGPRSKVEHTAEVEREISVKRCGNCGRELNEGERICPVCLELVE